MEAAANATATEYSRYGSTVHKQVYIYGGLDRGPTELTRNFGMAWGIGGWLLTPFLGKLGLEGHDPPARQGGGRADDHLRQPLHRRGLPRRRARASMPSATYARQATGQKFLIRPCADDARQAARRRGRATTPPRRGGGSARGSSSG